MTIKEIQKQLNLKFGFTLLVDGIAGSYTNLAIKLAKQEMGAHPINSNITDWFINLLNSGKIWMPEAMENITDYIMVNEDWWVMNEGSEKVIEWLKSRRRDCPFTKQFIEQLADLGSIFKNSSVHCLSNICIESAYGTSAIAKKYKNLVGMGITDSVAGRTYYKYLTHLASACDWYSLIEKYILRGQMTEQKLNISARRHKAEWFNFDSIKGFQNYATSQTKSMVVGKLVREIREVMK